MIDLLVPAVLLMNTPLVAEAKPADTVYANSIDVARKSQTSTPTFTSCQDVDHVNPSMSALGDFSPIGDRIARRFGVPRDQISVEWLAKINPKVTQILAPRHGEIELVYAPSFHYHYTANEGFEGKDSVSYLVEVQGRRFKVVINFWVVPVASENPSGAQDCQYQKFDVSELESDPTVATVIVGWAEARSPTLTTKFASKRWAYFVSPTYGCSFPFKGKGGMGMGERCQSNPSPPQSSP